MSRLQVERETVRAMLRIFCSERHGRALCSECIELLDYASARLARCPFGEGKPTCADCSVHCYTSVMRARIREIMRFSGARMVWRHPWLALHHGLGSLRPRRAGPARGLPGGAGR